ncbi:MAG TPA: HD domain-containing phosphohydrolase [Lacipirellulaceae bacterium]|jgi:HD-GYP domain-containing protein (c-di-GMP phosphodiesterase class II)|nr:HD domain-containing phosphohydrolase [Lacipirellulaceae bacterium]
MSASATETDLKRNPTSGYVPLRPSVLRSIDTAPADVYVQYDPLSDPVLYCRAGSPLSAHHFAELTDAGIEQVYVPQEKFEFVSSRLLDSLEPYFQKDWIPQAEKFAALQVAVSVEIEHSFRAVDCGAFQSVSERVGRQLVSLLAGSDVLPRDLYRLAQHDFSTFTHVTNVASYVVVLAEEMGMRDPAALKQIASAAMLHDIGKRFIAPAILHKAGQLEEEERETLESHPLRGYVELCDRPGLEFAQLMMVYQHHERIDGRGYPVKILGDEIHPWAKILSVANVFDGMTSKRGNRRPASVEHVLEFQRQQAGTQFDPEVVKCWISLMSKA